MSGFWEMVAEDRAKTKTKGRLTEIVEKGLPLSEEDSRWLLEEAQHLAAKIDLYNHAADVAVAIERQTIEKMVREEFGPQEPGFVEKVIAEITKESEDCDRLLEMALDGIPRLIKQLSINPQAEVTIQRQFLRVMLLDAMEAGRRDALKDESEENAP